MCGIAGSFPEADWHNISICIDRIKHRGPDASNIVETPAGTFGHARLAIIDVSGGHQPMQDGNHWVAFNGQIYNFQQLRANSPVSFKTNSDTEVILKYYDFYGPNCVTLFDGMFAIALAAGDDLFLARDPLGIKPLYYAVEGSRLYFASEIKALTNLGVEIREFPPGHWWHSRLGMQQYFQLDKPQLFATPQMQSSIPDSDDLACIQQAINSAVHKRMIADDDVPVGVSLSGGLDSSLVAALARGKRAHLDTFVVGTSESSDIQASQEVANYLGTRHHVYTYSFDEMLASLPEVIYHLESFDAPLVRSAIPNYFLAKLASDHVKVILTGEGADELFAGYDYLIPFQDPNELNRELKKLVSRLHNTNLQRADRMLMAYGLEGRVPFLDLAAVELSLAVPPEWKLRKQNWSEKALLREAFHGYLPKNILYRQKQKFSLGAGSINLMARYARETISDEEFFADQNLCGAPNIQSKEELLYFRIFRDVFGDQISPEIVGRTRSVTPEELN